jgi:hypothetical protein
MLEYPKVYGPTVEKSGEYLWAISTETSRSCTITVPMRLALSLAMVV